MDLKNANILVTGASSGIGKHIAIELSKKGANLILTGRNEERLSAVAKELNADGIVADVSKEEDVLKTYDLVQSKWGNLDVLINNAGFGEWETVDELSLESFQRVFGTNVFGAALMAREASKIFKKQKSGNIVNIASTAASKGFARGTVYAGSKFALAGMTQSWRAELRPFNVRVFQINPSEVTTAFGSDGPERDDEPNKLSGKEIAHSIVSALEMDDRGFITDLTVWATNPF